MVQLPWQAALNPQLTQRLLRPMVQPGVIPDTLAAAIFERVHQLQQRLSLLHQFEQRWAGQSALQVPDIPIVYAQWATGAQTINASPASAAPRAQPPSISPGSPPPLASAMVIQAKFASSPAAPWGSSQTMPLTDTPPPARSDQVSRQESLPSQEQTAPSSAPLPVAPAAVPPAVPSPLAEAPGDQPVVESAEPWPADSLANLPVVWPAPVSSKAETPTALPVVAAQPFTILRPAAKGLGVRATPKPQNRNAVNTGNAPIPNSPDCEGLQSTQRTGHESPSRGSSIARDFTRSVNAENVQAVIAPTSPVSHNSPVPGAMPLVVRTVTTSPSSISSRRASPAIAQPLILARHRASAQPHSLDAGAAPDISASRGASPLSSSVAVPSVSSSGLTTPSPPASLSSGELNRLTQQVERKLMRRLTVERERRGQQSWR